MTKENATESVRALARGLRVIEAFGGSRQGRTLADIAKEVDLSRATVRRLLLTLAELGYVTTNGRLFALTPRILALCYPYLSSVAVTDIMMPHMESVLEGSTYVSSSASMLDRSNVIFIAGVPAKGSVRASMTVGRKIPAVISSMGRVLLSQQPPERLKAILDESAYPKVTKYTITDRSKIEELIDAARADGYAVNNRELDVATTACAVPIFNRRGRCWAAMSASCHDPERDPDQFIKEFVPKLRNAADRVMVSLPVDPFEVDI